MSALHFTVAAFGRADRFTANEQTRDEFTVNKQTRDERIMQGRTHVSALHFTVAAFCRADTRVCPYSNDYSSLIIQADIL